MLDKGYWLCEGMVAESKDWGLEANITCDHILLPAICATELCSYLQEEFFPLTLCN